MIWIRSTLYAIFMGVTVAVFAILCVLAAPLPLKWRYQLTVAWPRLAVYGARVIAGIRWEVKGWENLPDAPAVILPKHQSAWETMFLAAFLPREICFVYKRELHWVPFFGWGLALLRMIPIDRSRGTDAFEQTVEKGKEQLAQGRWMIMFPAGTRTTVGKVGKYKSGGARCAIRTGAMAVPIAHNAGERWPRQSFLKKPGLITVSIGPPIDPTGMAPEVLNRQIQDWIEGEMRVISPERYRNADRKVDQPVQHGDTPSA